MEIEIHDTYVDGKKGRMHFDVAVPKGKGNAFAVESGKKWLESIDEKDAKITSKECEFCHTQELNEKYTDEMKKNGYAIIKMDGCPK